MPRKFKKKDKFEALPEPFRDAVAGMNEAEVRARISHVSLDDAALREARGNDVDFQRAREAATAAGQVYRDGAKQNRLKIDFCRRRLDDLCKPSGDATESQSA